MLNAANTYTGGTTVDNGTLQVGNVSALGTGGLAANYGTVDLTKYSPTVTSLSGGGGVITNSVSAATLYVNQSTSTNFGGTLQDGAAPLAISLSGSGLLNLSGANQHSGGTFMEGTGTLQVGNNAAFGLGGLTADNGTVDLAGFNPTVTTLSGSAGTITSGSVTGGSLTVTGTGSGVFSGTIEDGLDSPVSLVLMGGQLTLSGENPFSGGTLVSGGTLILGSTEAIADGSSLTVGSASIFPELRGTAVSVVPEPGALALLAAALWSAAIYRRFRRPKAFGLR